MKRVLLLMTSRTYKARAFLAAARRHGVAPVVGTDRTQVLSHLDPAGNLLLPFHDVERAVERIVEHHRVHPIDAVLATDDDGVVLAAHACSVLGLRGNSPQAVRDATDKLRTRQAQVAAGLPTPDFREVHDVAAARTAARDIGFPCVVKPLHLAASRGVMRVDDVRQLQTACDRLLAILRDAPHPDGPRWLVESYLPGAEHALEGVLCGGRLHELAIFDKPDPLEGPFFQETLYVTPSRLDARRQRDLWRAVQRTAAALQLVEGPVHAEVRQSAAGSFVLEVAPRSIGGRCSTALRFGPDGDLSLEEILLHMALQPHATPAAREPAASGVLMIPIPDTGILRAWRGEDAAMRVRGITSIERTIPLGQFVQPPPEGWRYLGFAFARAPRPEQVEQALREAHRRLQLDIEPSSQNAPSSREFPHEETS